LHFASGILSNKDYSLEWVTKILLKCNGNIVKEINTLDGDDMCMGFHGWKEGDFGDDDIIVLSDGKQE
jgi:hypothetical protein